MGRTALRVQLGGGLLALAGIFILMGIITAETQYPVALHYSTRANEISNLGATMPPHSIITEPSALIFDWTMRLTGAMIMAGAILAYEAHRSRLLSALTVLLGCGVLGVGLFPENHPHIHRIFSITAFLFGGLSAAFSCVVTRGAFRWVTLLLGLTTLFCLVIGTHIFLHMLGPGGLERWVAYPIVLWLTGYGGYVLGKANVSATGDA